MVKLTKRTIKKLLLCHFYTFQRGVLTNVGVSFSRQSAHICHVTRPGGHVRCACAAPVKFERQNDQCGLNIPNYLYFKRLTEVGRMYIKSVVIDGFKSYAQRTEINGFDPQFNAITGLNGSGKSNILDSICFLLGISNLSQVFLAIQ